MVRCRPRGHYRSWCNWNSCTCNLSEQSTTTWLAYCCYSEIWQLQRSSICWEPTNVCSNMSYYCYITNRGQLPWEATVAFAWALTIQKRQGLTLPKAWIDIGKTERTPGVSYVAISRVKALDSCVIEPMTCQWLTGLKSSANLQYRLQEENRLYELAHATCNSFPSTNY